MLGRTTPDDDPITRTSPGPCKASEDSKSQFTAKRVRQHYSFANADLREASELFVPRDCDHFLWARLAKPRVIAIRPNERRKVDAQCVQSETATIAGEQNVRLSLPRRLRRAAALVFFLLALPVPLVTATFVYSDEVERRTGDVVSAILGGDDVTREMSERLACATRGRIADLSGQTVGWIPVSSGCALPGQSPAGGQIASPHLWTSPIEDNDSLELLGPAIAALEGDHSGSGTLFALNARGLVRVLLREVRRIWAPGLARQGGSTAVLSGFETLRDMHGRSMTAHEKLGHMRDMVAYVAANLPHGVERDRFAAMTNPVILIHGGSAGGMSVSGAIALEALFGRRHLQAQWEACLFASAFYLQIGLPGTNAPVDVAMQRNEIFQKRLSTAKERADGDCLTRLEKKGLLSTAEAETERRHLEDFSPQQSYWTNGTAQRLPGAFAALHDHRMLAGAENNTTHTHLTSYAQWELSAAVNALRDRTSQVIGEGLCYSDCDSDEHVVDILAVAVELRDGEENVAAIYQTRSGLFHGPLTSDDAGWVRGEVTRGLGSLPKLYVALHLAAKGITRLCPRDALGLRDADGSAPADCDDPAQWLNLQEAMARSSNRALAEGIRLVGLRAITEGMRSLGAEVANGQLHRRIVTGIGVPNSPERFLRFLAALARGRDGQAPIAGLPQISVALRKAILALPEELFEGDMTLLREVLAAPVLHRRGTLRALHKPLVVRGCDMASIIAKSGTSETSDPAGTGVRDRYIAVRAICIDRVGVPRDMATFVMVGSPRIDVPLEGVTADDVRALTLGTLDAGLLSAAADNPAATDGGK